MHWRNGTKYQSDIDNKLINNGISIREVNPNNGREYKTRKQMYKGIKYGMTCITCQCKQIAVQDKCL